MSLNRAAASVKRRKSNTTVTKAPSLRRVVKKQQFDAKWSAENLNTICKSDGRTVGQIAEAAGITRAHLHSLKSGASIPSVDTAIRLMRALGQPFEDFMD